MSLSCSIAVKKSFAVPGSTTSKHVGNFCCLNGLYSFRSKIKLQPHEKLCENKGFGGFVLPSEGSKIL